MANNNFLLTIGGHIGQRCCRRDRRKSGRLNESDLRRVFRVRKNWLNMLSGSYSLDFRIFCKYIAEFFEPWDTYWRLPEEKNSSSGGSSSIYIRIAIYKSVYSI